MVGFVFVAALWACCHPYCGIVGDSNVYLGRVLADLDPLGVGSDLMFVNDGQSQFSLFRLVARPVVAALGTTQAGVVIAAAGTACWFLALCVLAQALASDLPSALAPTPERRRVAWAMIVIVAILPLDYGDPGIFAFGETAALPRPFAEAAVMAGLAATLQGRLWLAGICLAVAVLFHPLMAIAGLGVAFVLCVWHVRWLRSRAGLLAGLGGLGVCLLLAWSGVPLFDRLMQTIDSFWFGRLVQRSPHLFPSLWDAAAFAPIVAQVATVAIAAQLASPPQRRVFVAVMIVAALGLAASAILGDTVRLLLVVQVQTWRATWLLGVVGGCGLALCTSGLWHRGPRGRLTLALIVLAWFFQPHPAVTIVVSGLALVLHFGSIGARLPIGDRCVAMVTAIVGVLIANWYLGTLIGYFDHLRHLSEGQRVNIVDPLRNNLHTLPIFVVVAIWLVMSGDVFQRGQKAAFCLGTGLLVLATGWFWDQRGDTASYFTRPQVPAGFMALAAGRPREVLWLDGGAEAWYMLHRPQYLSPQQEVSIVFSRPLAKEWYRRATRLVELGLAKKAIFTPRAPIDADDRLRVTQGALDALCRQPDAPGTVIIPIDRGEARPPLRDLIIWPLPTPRFLFHRYSVEETQVIVAYGIVPCAARLVAKAS